MSVIALISCNTTRDPYPIYPLGLTMVAEAARQDGHTVEEFDFIIDGRDEDALNRFIARVNPDYIGLSLRNIDSVNYNKQESYIGKYSETVQAIKALTGAPVILGGSAYSIFPEALLEATGADYGIPGEGEKAFCTLLSRLNGGEPIPQSVFSDTTPMAAGEISITGRNEAYAAFYLRHGGMLNLQTKRGCPHRCLYCSYPHLEGRRYRFRSPEDVVEEIELLTGRYGADYLSITDSVFNDSRGHYLTIAETMVRKSIDVRWMCFMRPQIFQDDEIELLKASGLAAVEWGTDASTDITLEGMQKSFSWHEVENANNMFAEAHIPNSHFIIFGGPGETPATVEEGLKNIGRLDRCVVFASTGIRVFPHTPVYHSLTASGDLDPQKNLLEPHFYFSPQADPALLDEALRSSFEGRQDRIYPDGQIPQQEKIQAFHDMGYRGPAWDLILRDGKTRRRR